MYTDRLLSPVKAGLRALLALLAVFAPALLHAQSTTVLNEDFTGASTTNNWFFYNGACLTAGTSTTLTEPGPVPSCITVLGTYYNVANPVTGKIAESYLTGGNSGYLGGTTAPSSPSGQLADPTGSGALRFTNGYPYGYHENGAIVSGNTFPTGAGVAVTFKTVTYLGDSGGGGKDGADGISFYLLDGCMPLSGTSPDSSCKASTIYGSQTFPGIGAWGGSLAYTCSNANPPYDGLVGGYIGLGIDEYGNFLNGVNNTLGETGSTSTGGDNTASGGLYQPGRIGLRGAGSVAWTALTTAYGTSAGSSSPYYPASLASTCSNGGVYNASTQSCGPTCSVGTYYPAGNTCNTCASGYTFYPGDGKCYTCPTGGTYQVSSNTCSGIATCGGSGTYVPSTNTCTSPAGYCTTGTYMSADSTCHSCQVGYTYVSSTDTCWTCPVGTYLSGGTCNPAGTCATGTYYASGNLCGACSNGATYNSTNNTCSPAGACATGTYYPTGNTCGSCNNGATYSVGSNSCSPAGWCSSGAYRTSDTKCYTCSSSNGSGLVLPLYTCDQCPSGSIYDANAASHGGSASKQCGKCTLSGVYNPSTGTCSAGVASFVAQTTGVAPVKTASAANLVSNPSTANLTTSSAAANSPTSGIVVSVAATPYVPVPIPPTSRSPTTSSPSTGVPISILAVQKTCKTGHLYNYTSTSSPTDVGPATLPTDPTTPNAVNTAGILDYGALPSAYSVLPTTLKIAAESSTTRTGASPIFYSLKITQDGLLSLSYSINGGAYTNVINKLDITKSNGPLPASFRFGFAGSTGGSDNIHEIMCFKAAPDTLSASSAGINQKVASKIQGGSQAYFAYYDPLDSTGRVSAYGLSTDPATGAVDIASLANWDASCDLTGVASGATCLTTGTSGPTAAQTPASRVMLSWNGTQGVPFEWTSGISSAQQTALGSSDRLNYLRGDRTNEVNSSGTGEFRRRDAVLADIIDSSPVWVGAPSGPYTSAMVDKLNAADPLPENSATQSYVQFKTAFASRQNVVYAGANDGFLHAFRTENADGTGTNDGAEVLAYMPGLVVNTIHNADPTLDFTSTSYGHNYFVDATPGSGDLFYSSGWHTWLAGGLGAGGAAIYILDITDPSQYSESNANSLVIGEWTAGTDATTGAISCLGNGVTNNTNCGQNLGNTYDTPKIHRLHNGMWGVIFGNGTGSATGDAGIYVMTIDPTTLAKTFYYLGTGSGSATTPGSDGIMATSPSDLDGDKVVDYVYAGDVLGNLWRFDLTSADPTKWAAASTPLFKTATGQPITTAVAGGYFPSTSGKREMIVFGTGQKTPMTNTSPITYLKTAQSLYGVWDWNMSSWNAKSSVQLASLPPTSTGLTNAWVTPADLQVNTVTIDPTTGDHMESGTPKICFAGATDCAPSPNNKFGWSIALPESNSQGNEQIVFNPTTIGTVFSVNSVLPANNTPTSCAVNTDKGWSYGIDWRNGGNVNFFVGHDGAIGVEEDATGTSATISNANGTYQVFQTVTNDHKAIKVNLPSSVSSKRLTWIELR